MEEIQSTEIIDREILEDARKKAWRILKTADETVKAQTAEWEKKNSDNLDELYKKYEKRREKTALEIISRLPMEKRRIKAQAIDHLLNNAVHTWYTGLNRDFIINLIKDELAVRLGECCELFCDSCRVKYKNLSSSEVHFIINGMLKNIKPVMEEVVSREEFPELIVENEYVRVTASVKKAIDFFLQKKRSELTSALVGNGIFDSDVSSGETNMGEDR